MGLSNSWIAIQGLDRAAALEQLELETTIEVPPDNLPDFAVGEAPSGWLIFFTRGEEAFEDRFVALSRGRTAVACFEEEHVMHSEARGYADGVETWRVVHEAEKGQRHLAVSGAAPETLAAIRDRHEAKADADVDFIFEVPPDVAKTVCGWRFLDKGSDEVVFHELRRRRPVRSPTGRPGFLARLFGRG